MMMASTPPPERRVTVRHSPEDEKTTTGSQDEQEEAAWMSVWKSPWWRLGALVLLFFLGLIIVASIKPFDRLVTFLLPVETTGLHDNNQQSVNHNSTVNSSYSKHYSQLAPPAPFTFRQCSDNATLCCNGLENACDLRINEVMLATVHNAMATKEDGSLLEPNHFLSLERALEAGYRGLHLEVCKCNGVYEFCNGVCQLGSRNPIEVFLNIDRFLRDHREEVIVLHLQINSHVHQEVSLQELYQVMQNATQFNRNLYIQKSNRARWPTLRKMIEMDKRVLLFHSNGPSCEDEECPSGMHNWNDHVLETEMIRVRKGGLGDLGTTCNLEIPSQNAKAGKRKFLELRHYLSTPDYQVAERMNQYAYISQRVDSCSMVSNKDVSLLSVDYWSLGTDVIEFAMRQNKGRVSIAH
ncbi:integral membrane protein [Seminavis robusta]|uniref:Integral membrane protein n=1 Tax=Seminavis robusta TaxID=568900 RepID=A0A9N8HJ84_9STRA|nr:integral membrane protein [Seminavis robusta]|eukprot:Sro675_g185470.1 integral membrane protein (410) ;mRNA; f:23477-24818